jgi:hypothetical protein
MWLDNPGLSSAASQEPAMILDIVLMAAHREDTCECRNRGRDHEEALELLLERPDRDRIFSA